MGIHILIAHRKMNVGIWERGRAVSFLGILVSNFRYSVFAVHAIFWLHLHKFIKIEFHENDILQEVSGQQEELKSRQQELQELKEARYGLLIRALLWACYCILSLHSSHDYKLARNFPNFTALHCFSFLWLIANIYNFKISLLIFGVFEILISCVTILAR